MIEQLDLAAVGQFLVAVATILVALATWRQAKITEKAFLLGIRPLIRADWEISSQSLTHVTLVATIREITSSTDQVVQPAK